MPRAPCGVMARGACSRGGPFFSEEGDNPKKGVADTPFFEEYPTNRRAWLSAVRTELRSFSLSSNLLWRFATTGELFKTLLLIWKKRRFCLIAFSKRLPTNWRNRQQATRGRFAMLHIAGADTRHPIHFSRAPARSTTEDDTRDDDELHNKPAHAAVPLASAHQHPGNQKENQAGHSSERAVEGHR